MSTISFQNKSAVIHSDDKIVVEAKVSDPKSAKYLFYTDEKYRKEAHAEVTKDKFNSYDRIALEKITNLLVSDFSTSPPSTTFTVKEVVGRLREFEKRWVASKVYTREELKKQQESLLSTMWDNLAAEEKKEYEDKYAEQRKLYHRQHGLGEDEKKPTKKSHVDGQFFFTIATTAKFPELATEPVKIAKMWDDLPNADREQYNQLAAVEKKKEKEAEKQKDKDVAVDAEPEKKKRVKKTTKAAPDSPDTTTKKRKLHFKKNHEQEPVSSSFSSSSFHPLSAALPIDHQSVRLVVTPALSSWSSPSLGASTVSSASSALEEAHEDDAPFKLHPIHDHDEEEDQEEDVFETPEWQEEKTDRPGFFLFASTEKLTDKEDAMTKWKVLPHHVRKSWAQKAQ